MGKRILFSLRTPGHLINSLSIIGELEKENSSFHYCFIDFCKEGRSVTGLDAFQFKSDQYSVVRVDNKEERLLDGLAPILDLSFDRIFIYLEYPIENAFLAAHFKKKNSIICLGNDGNRPYYKINRWAIKSRLIETSRFYRAALKNKLPVIPRYIYNLKYGNLRYIDEHWMPFEMKKDWSHIKEPIKKYHLLNQATNKLIDETFAYLDEVLNSSFPRERIIFHTNNILYRDETYLAEVDALRTIKEQTKFPLVIKMHPATPEFQQRRFEEVGDYVFQNTVPAEMYMKEIKDSIFLSGWSSSLLFDNKQNCQYYWLYSYLVEQGLPIKDLVDFSLPDTHINHPTNLNRITLT